MLADITDNIIIKMVVGRSAIFAKSHRRYSLIASDMPASTAKLIRRRDETLKGRRFICLFHGFHFCDDKLNYHSIAAFKVKTNPFVQTISKHYL